MKSGRPAFLVCSGLGPQQQPPTPPSPKTPPTPGGAPLNGRPPKPAASGRKQVPSESPAQVTGVSTPPTTPDKQPSRGFSRAVSLQELTGRAGRLLRSQRPPGSNVSSSSTGAAGAGTVPSAATAAAWLAKRRAAWQEPVAVSSLVEDVLPQAAPPESTSMSKHLQRDSAAAVSAEDHASAGAGAAAEEFRETLSSHAVASDSLFREVVVIFGKRLVRDQITYEYAVRILTLARHMATGRIRPSAVCFTGGRDHEDSLVSEAVAGYLFFRHVCEEIGLQLNNMTILLEEQHLNARDCMSSILSQLGEHLVGSHFTFVSSDYHLIRIREVEASVPNVSLLAPLRKLRGTVSYAYATYPFALSKDAAVALSGRAIVAAAELGITIVALRSYIEGRDLFHRDIFTRFQEATMVLGNLSEQCSATLQVQVAGAAPALDGALFTQDIRQVAEVIEKAFFELRQIIRAMEPWIQEKSTLSRVQLQEMLQKIVAIEQNIRQTIDPDRPLTAMEWYRLPTAFLAPALGAVYPNDAVPKDDDVQSWPASTSTSMSAAESVAYTSSSATSWRPSTANNAANAASLPRASSALPVRPNPLQRPSMTPLDTAAARLRHFASKVSEASQAIIHEVLRPDFHEERARRISEENRRRKRAAATPGLDAAPPSLGTGRNSASPTAPTGASTMSNNQLRPSDRQASIRRQNSSSFTPNSTPEGTTAIEHEPPDGAAA